MDRMQKAIQLLDEMAYFAKNNAEASNKHDKAPWEAHARKCAEVRDLILHQEGHSR